MSLPGLTLVSGPIGNLGDLTPRAQAVMASCDIWLVEDTRVAGRLANHLGLKKPMSVVNDHTSPRRLEELVSKLGAGQTAALLTDAGTPGVSDPGAALVDLCHEAGVLVDALPGPSAPVLALALSGFFAQRFAFLGFLPRKASACREVLAPFQDSTLTLILFESPHRFLKVLESAGGILGSRRYAICREMTKLHQQVWRSRLPELPSPAEVPAKGEFTLVVEGIRRTDNRDEY